MSRTVRDFYKRSEEEQQSFLSETWCNECMSADLGMTDPEEYEQEERIFIEGRCKVCSNPVVTELIDEDL
jgi:hypothetical protein